MQLVVAHENPSKKFTLTSYKINDKLITLPTGADGDYEARLSGQEIPDPTNGYNIEIVLELNNVSYTYEIKLPYSGT